MKNKQNNLSKTKKKSELPFLTALVLAFVMISLGGMALVSQSGEKYRNVFYRSIFSEDSSEAGMKKFSNYNELKEFLDASSVSSSSMFGMRNQVFLNGSISKEMALNKIESGGSWGDATSISVPGKGGGDDYSTTNVQVAGVDEGDIVKTDGEYIYAIAGQEVIITKAYPAVDSEITARIKFDSNISGMYLNGNKLAVYGQDYNVYRDYEEILPRKRNSQFTFFKVYDISDRSNPKEERDVDFEGNYTNSRMIGNYIYFVTSNYSYYGDDESAVPIILENNKIVSGGENSMGRDFPNVYYFDIPYYSYNFMTVSAVNIASPSQKISNDIYLLDSNQNNMFVSKDNIYITFVKRINEEELLIDIMKEIILPKLSKKDRDRIAEIEKTESYILSPQEKIEKIGMIIERFGESLSSKEQEQVEQELERKVEQKYEDISKELEKTVIHKINIDGGVLKYKAVGEVPGVILNQFSMDEDNGYFRIATTKNRNWSRFSGWDERESYSNLYVLDDKMKVVGKVEGLAKGERIYSVRFMQNRAYLVTFKQVDPLFVIDLSSPTKPKVMGELKVPGYSSYLHPYDETTLIGLGKETDQSGRITGGIKLSLFDVSDISNPKEIDKYVLGDRNSNSIAINEHKAFLFSREKNLLVIPVNMQNEIIWDIVEEEESLSIMPSAKRKYFNGAAVFNINKKGFELKGMIDHSDGSNQYNYQTSVNRSLYIEEVLYTLSQQYLKMNELSSLKEVNSLLLNKVN